MNTLKNGSKGEDVKTLQQKLNGFSGYGLTVDGIFGVKTEWAVRAFQDVMGLSVDGIVGPKTWAALGVNATSSKAIDESVIYKPLPVHVTEGRQKPMYLAIHYTAGANSKPGKAEGNYDTFMKREASADFAVDDRDMVQFNPDIDKYYCWSVGDDNTKYSSGGKLKGKATNRNTISIELCSTLQAGTSASKANHSGWSFTDAVIDNAVKLSKIVMKKYDIPLERVVRHYDISGKMCPGVIGWNNETIYDTKGNKTSAKSDSSKWEEFKKRLA